MKKYFATSEISLRLRKLGFNEKFFGVYCDKDGSVRRTELYETGDAVLWQQAIDFLFEKLDNYYPYLNVEIFSDNSGNWHHPADEDIESFTIDFDNKEQMILTMLDKLELCQM